MVQQQVVRPQALQAEQWQDVYMRHNFGDTGLYPTSGALSQSPDIIPAGNVPYSDPNQLIADNNWVVDFGSSTYASRANYIYVRGQNLGPGDTTAKVYLYGSPASLLLYPTDPLDPKKGWANNPIRTDAGGKFVELDVAGKARFVTAQPFNWIPEPIHNDHYCLVARVTTDDNPNPIPTTGNLNDFGRYISEHPNMAWRNVNTMNPSSPTWSTQVEYEQGDIGGEVYFFLECINAPDGSAIEFSAAGGAPPNPNPPISFPKTTVVNKPGKDNAPTFIAAITTSIPENWRSLVTYTWFSEGRTPLPDMKISIKALIPVGGESTWASDLAAFGTPIEELILHEEWAGPLFRSGAGPIKAMPLGSDTMKGQPASLEGATDGFAAAERSSVYLSGFSWFERATSLVSRSTVEGGVSIARGVERGAEMDVLHLGMVSPDELDAELTVDMDLAAGVEAGTTFFALVTTNVPKGCVVWFKDVAGGITIETAKSTVDKEPTYTIGTMVELPGGYSGRVRGYLDRMGKTLPASWSLRMSAVHVNETLSQKALAKLMSEGGPVPGTQLGAISVQG